MFCFYKSQEIQFYLHAYSGTYLYSNLLAPKLENFSKTALEKLFNFFCQGTFCIMIFVNTDKEW